MEYNPLIEFKQQNCKSYEIDVFNVFLEDLSILDLGFGFLVKNYVYSRLETSGNPQFGQHITNFSFEKVFVKT